MPLGTYVAGAYTGAWTPNGGGSGALGQTREGYRLRWQYGYDTINSTDAYGQTVVEEFLQSLGVWIGGTWVEYTSQILRTTTTWGALAAAGATAMDLGVISRAASNIAGQLVLTATAGTPAAAAPASLTAVLCYPDSNFSHEMVLGPAHREIPFMLKVLPSTISGATRFFSCT